MRSISLPSLLVAENSTKFLSMKLQNKMNTYFFKKDGNFNYDKKRTYKNRPQNKRFRL